ncbi:13544_t:CDS:1 [Funneliformis geosporum]|uniref:7887_t:CDS:1 n=1 Tax=Funneliformis geosporum TaxID=1117311 RepID=A0A9W4X1S3_9GLOM|nr:7887_t:CDS:1 [Funneliformis geosporum]CAI2189028.1 13544_t:CDS:1 [Funneliformis geosporum]
MKKNKYTGYWVWIQNKIELNIYTWTGAFVFNDEGKRSWINVQAAKSHDGYHLKIPNDIKQYWLAFSLNEFKDFDQEGPFNNDEDICWYWHGHEHNWKVYP